MQRTLDAFKSVTEPFQLETSQSLINLASGATTVTDDVKSDVLKAFRKISKGGVYQWSPSEHEHTLF